MSLLARLHRRVHRRRVRILAAGLAELLPRGATVLDVGCGDGRVAAALAERRPDLAIAGLDLAVRPDAAIAVEPFDGRRIPRGDGEVDAVMLVDVVHHAEEPRSLLAEAARVAAGCVVVKDHLREGLLAGPTLRLMDVVGNRRHGVATPFHYWTRGEWRAAVDGLGLAPSAWREELGLYPAPASWIFDRSLHFLARLEARR